LDSAASNRWLFLCLGRTSPMLTKGKGKEKKRKIKKKKKRKKRLGRRRVSHWSSIRSTPITPELQVTLTSLSAEREGRKTKRRKKKKIMLHETTRPGGFMRPDEGRIEQGG